jgi:hypothetical protein
MASEPAETRNVKLLGREPSAWVATAGALLVALAALGVPFLSAGQAAALTALIAAVILMATTRPIVPGLATGVVTAAVALLAAYGLVLPDVAVAAVSALTLSFFALVTRQQVTPKETIVTRE